MFKEVLRDVVDRTEGGVAGLVMGFDGIAVEHYVRDTEAVDVQAVGMEYSVILREIRKAAEMLDIGSAREVAVRAEHMTTIMRLLNEEYFVAVTVRPDGNSGRARYLLRMRAGDLLQDLQ